MSFTLKMTAPEKEGVERPILALQPVKPSLNRATKIRYVSPSLTVMFVGLESGLAAGSVSRVQIGSPGDPNTPQVEDWTLDGTNNQINL